MLFLRPSFPLILSLWHCLWPKQENVSQLQTAFGIAWITDKKHIVRILSLSAHRPIVSSWGEGHRQRPPEQPSHCPCSRATLSWRYSKFDGSCPQCLSPATLGTTLGTRVVVQQRSRQYGKILNSACISVSQRNSGQEDKLPTVRYTNSVLIYPSPPPRIKSYK